MRTEEQSGDIVVKDIMCGDEAAAARSMLQITYPVCLFPIHSCAIPIYGRESPLPGFLTVSGLIHIAINTDGEWYRQEMG